MVASLSRTLAKLASAVFKVKSAELRAESEPSRACWTIERMSLAWTTERSASYFLLLAAYKSPLESYKSAKALLYSN